jgi:hypothetical protein
MGTVAEDIADKLAALGMGTVGSDIWIGMMPERPDVVAVVYESAGQPPETGFSVDGLQYESPNVQVVMRGERGDYEGPRTRAETAYKELAKIQAVTLGSNLYHMVRPVQSPFPLMRDDDARVLVAFNAICKREVV